MQTVAAELAEVYLVAQAGGPLKQSLPRVFIDNQPPDLGGHWATWGRFRSPSSLP